MMQVALLAVNGDRIVRRVGHAVGFVVADHEPVLAPQQMHQNTGKAGIAVVEHAHMPGPRDALEHRRKAVHGDQRRRPAGSPPPIQHIRDRVVIGLKYLANTGLDLRFAEADISRNGRELAQFDYRRLRARHAVGVDDEAGIVLPYDHCIELVPDQATNLADADIPGNVTFEFRLRKTERSKTPRQIVPGVIGGDDQRRSAALAGHRDGLRFVRREKPRRHVIHGASFVRKSHRHRLGGVVHWLKNCIVSLDVDQGFECLR